MPNFLSRTPEEISQIKALIWHGAIQREIAEATNLSQSQISRIATGHCWGEVPWPNGDLGALPESRCIELRDIHRATPHLGKAMQTRVRAAPPPTVPNPDAQALVSQIAPPPVALDPRQAAQATGFTPEVRQALEEQAQEIDKEMDRELLDAISDPGESPEVPPTPMRKRKKR